MVRGIVLLVLLSFSLNNKLTAQTIEKTEIYNFKDVEKIKEFANKSLEKLNEEKKALEISQQNAGSDYARVGYRKRIATISDKINSLQKGLEDYLAALDEYRIAPDQSTKEQAMQDALSARAQIDTYRLNLSLLLPEGDYFKQKQAFKDLTTGTILSRLTSKRNNVRLLDLNTVAVNLLAEANKRAYELLGTSYAGENKNIGATLKKIIVPLTPSSQANAATIFALVDFDRKVTSHVSNFGENIADEVTARAALRSELEVLNTNYTKVVNAIKKIDPNSILPNELTLQNLQKLATAK